MAKPKQANTAAANKKKLAKALLGVAFQTTAGDTFTIREWTMEQGHKITPQLLGLLEVQTRLGAESSSVEFMLTNALQELQGIVAITLDLTIEELNEKLAFRDFLEAVQLVNEVCLAPRDSEEDDRGPLGSMANAVAMWVAPFRMAASSPDPSTASSETDTPSPTS